MNNIDKTHPGAKDLLKKGGIAVARSLIPGSLSAVDKTMKESFMKFAKSAGTISNLFIYTFHFYQKKEDNMHIVAYATGRNDTEVYRSYFIHSVNQVKLQYINTQSSMTL